MKTLILLFLLALPALANDIDAAWASARDAYGRGDFLAAAQAYENIRAKGVSSAALEYNLGNAWYRAGRMDRAIAHYRHAQWLAPHDPDLKANLARAVGQAGSLLPELPWYRRASAFLGQRAWQACTWTLLWMLSLYGIAGLWSPGLRRSAAWVVPALFGLAALAAAAVWASSPARMSREAVLLGESATARFEPHADATAHFSLPGGSVVSTEERQGRWMRIRSGDKAGWIPEESLVRLGGA